MQRKRAVFSYVFLFIFLLLAGCGDKKKVSADFQVGCEASAGSVLQLANLSMNATKFSWDFGNGIVSNLRSPSVTYDSPGQFKITLIAADDSGKTDQIEKNINVISVPATKILNISYAAQKTQTWCWAASTQMVLNNFNVNIDQCSLVNYYILGHENFSLYIPNMGYCNCCNLPVAGYYDFFGNYYTYYNCQIGGYTFQIANDLKRLGDLSSQTINRALTFEEIKLEIAAGRPIIIFYLPSSINSQSGHYVVLFGYNSFTGELYIYDPYFPSNPYNAYAPQYWVVPFSGTFSYQNGTLYWGTSIYKIGATCN